MRFNVEGNLLTSDCNVILHQVNCKGVMGAGIARSIRNMYPEVYHDYMKAYKEDKLVLGNIIRTKTLRGPIVYSLCGQDTYGRSGKHTDESALDICFRRVVEDLKQYGSLDDFRVGVPAGIGAGLGGGDWNLISKSIDKMAKYVNVYVYRYKS